MTKHEYQFVMTDPSPSVGSLAMINELGQHGWWAVGPVSEDTETWLFVREVSSSCPPVLRPAVPAA
jgi:hypothetical protein